MPAGFECKALKAKDNSFRRRLRMSVFLIILAVIVVASMHQRKSQMADMSDGFIALPGGIGTLEGFFEVLTWGQLGIHAKPAGILNVEGYFDKMTGFLDHAVQEGFLRDTHRDAIIVESDPRALLERMRAFTPAEGEKLMGRTHR
jgi:uncharacterized protein (TIGR00730 family)